MSPDAVAPIRSVRQTMSQEEYVHDTKDVRPIRGTALGRAKGARPADTTSCHLSARFTVPVLPNSAHIATGALKPLSRTENLPVHVDLTGCQVTSTSHGRSREVLDVEVAGPRALPDEIRRAVATEVAARLVPPRGIGRAWREGRARRAPFSRPCAKPRASRWFYCARWSAPPSAVTSAGVATNHIVPNPPGATRLSSFDIGVERQRN